MAEGRGAAPTRERASLEEYLKATRHEVDEALDQTLPPEERPPQELHRAMRYSLFAGGKRLRPILVLTVGRACGADTPTLLPAACAVELIHTYSLIHDDLPSFDDDDVRRGLPTNHMVYGEAVAILAGDALQTEAFALLADAAREAVDPRPWLASIAELAAAAGSAGMVGGQFLDIEAEGQALEFDALQRLHAAKTGALLTACVRIGAHIGGAGAPTLEALTRYGRDIGLAFQVVDDILDVEGSLQDLGKQPGADADRDKPTYPALLGVEGARAEAEKLQQRAIEALRPLGDRGDRLADLARFIVERTR